MSNILIVRNLHRPDRQEFKSRYQNVTRKAAEKDFRTKNLRV